MSSPVVSTQLVSPFSAVIVTSTSPLLTPMAPPPGYSQSQLLFEDQFAGSALNLNNWNPNLGDALRGRYTGGGVLPSPLSGQPSGKLDGEYFSPSQITTAPSGLTLTAQQNAVVAGYTWVSGCISTYGKFATPPPGFYAQFRAKQPDCSTGMWCRIFFLDLNGANEIDLQNGGVWPSPSYNATMAPSLEIGTTAAPLNINTNTDLTANYHIYGVEYISGNSIKIFFDGQLVKFYESRNTFIPQLAQYEIVILLGVFNTPAASIPAVTAALFQALMPLSNGQAVGTMVATNNPTSWALSGTGAPDFAISALGLITIANASVITAQQQFSLTATGTNTAGSGSALVSIQIITGPPAVTGATFMPISPLTANQVMGTVVASNFPQTWAIVGGNGSGSGNFAISNTGIITVTSQGTTLAAGTQTISVQATNSAGPGGGIVNIVITAFANVETHTLANAISPPASNAWLTSADNLITALKTANVWTTLDLFYCWAAPTAQAASLNWRNPNSSAQTLVTNGTITQTALAYAQGDGSTGFFSTSFAMNSGLATNGNACVGYFCMNDDAGTTSCIGTNSATSRTFLGVAGNNTPISNASCGVNMSTSLSVSSQWGSSVGHWVAQQTTTTNLQVYLDGAQIGSGTGTNAVDNGNIQFLMSGGAFSAKQLTFAHVGSQLSAAAQLAFSQALYSFLSSAAIGVRPKIGVPGGASGPTNIAPYKHVCLGNGTNSIVPVTTSTILQQGLVQGGRGGLAYPYAMIRVNDPNYLNIWRFETHNGDNAPTFDTANDRIQLSSQTTRLPYGQAYDICFAFLIEAGSVTSTNFMDLCDFHNNNTDPTVGPTHGLQNPGPAGAFTGYWVAIWPNPPNNVKEVIAPLNDQGQNTTLFLPVQTNTWYMARTQWQEATSAANGGFVNTWFGPLPSGPFTEYSYTGPVGNQNSTQNFQNYPLYRAPQPAGPCSIWYANIEFDASTNFPFAARLINPLPVPPINA